MNFIVRMLLLALLLSFPLSGMAQEVEQGTGLVCDTAENIEQFVILHNQGMKNPDILATINGDKEPFVCAVFTAAFFKGKTVKLVLADGQVYEIAEILLVGVLDGQWVHITPTPQFSIFLTKERGA